MRRKKCKKGKNVLNSTLAVQEERVDCGWKLGISRNFPLKEILYPPHKNVGTHGR